MKCLYCGKRLALLRKLTDSEFCSDLHRRLYQQEQEKMAVARLVDAQKRLSGSAAEKPSKNGRGKSAEKVKAAARQPEPMPQEELADTFLPDIPQPVGMGDQKVVEALPMAAKVATFLPDFLDYSALRKQWSQQQVQLENEAVLPYLNPSVSAPEALDCLLQAELPALKPLAAAHAVGMGAVEGSTYGANQAANVRPDILLQASSPADLQPLAALPFNSSSTIPEPQPVMNLAEESVDIPEPTIEPFVAQPELVVLATEEVEYVAAESQASEPQASEPELVSAEAAVIEDAECPRPPVEKLFAMPKPAISAGRRPIRRVRARELFFPLPKLGDLSSLASIATRKTVPLGKHSGVRGRKWRPGLVAATIRLNVVNYPKTRGALFFPWIASDLSGLTVKPYPMAANLGVPTLAEGERYDDIDAFLSGESAKDAARKYQPEVEFREFRQQESHVPSLSVNLETSDLPNAIDLQPQEIPAANISTCCRTETAFCDLAHTEHMRTPFLMGGAGASLELSSSCTMAPVKPSAERNCAPAILNLDTEFMPETKQPEATFPASEIVLDFKPSRSGDSFPMQLGEGIPYPSKTVAMQELMPFWPEATSVRPRMNWEMVEDNAVREAVRAVTAMMAQERRNPFSAIRMPSLTLSRPDLKWFVMSVPAMLLLALYAFTSRDRGPQQAAAVKHLPPVEESVDLSKAPTPFPLPLTKPEQKPLFDVKAEAAKEEVKVVPASAQGGFVNDMNQLITKRAAISLSDDFRTGLGDWEGRGEWPKTWSYDSAGFLHTGAMALYKPSLSLTDYSMEFLGQIDKRSIGWAYRATDFENYYATKIVLTSGGPIPTAVIERYAIIKGKATSMARRPLPLSVRKDTLYRVKMDIRGNGFTLTVQGEVVDYWSDDRLKSGGIGFFSERGEQASLRWVEISHQYDFLGRLCAFLAPYSLPAKEGSSKP